jgi:Tfp pilus assembly protein PilV
MTPMRLGGTSDAAMALRAAQVAAYMRHHAVVLSGKGCLKQSVTAWTRQPLAANLLYRGQQLPGNTSSVIKVTVL